DRARHLPLRAFLPLPLRRRRRQRRSGLRRHPYGAEGPAQAVPPRWLLTMAILIKTPAEIDKMRRSGEALRQVHEAVRPLVVPGASTMDLENAAAAKMD